MPAPKQSPRGSRSVVNRVVLTSALAAPTPTLFAVKTQLLTTVTGEPKASHAPMFSKGSPSVRVKWSFGDSLVMPDTRWTRLLATRSLMASTSFVSAGLVGFGTLCKSSKTPAKTFEPDPPPLRVHGHALRIHDRRAVLGRTEISSPARPSRFEKKESSPFPYRNSPGSAPNPRGPRA